MRKISCLGMFGCNKHGWKCPDLIKKIPDIFATNTAGNVLKSPLKNTRLCHNKHVWKCPDLSPKNAQFYKILSLQTWFEMSRPLVKKYLIL